MSQALLDALAAHEGIVCAVGAGGKKSLLYRLLSAHSGRVGLTASAMSAPPPRRLVDWRGIESAQVLDEQIPRAAMTHRRLAFACPSEKSGRVSGLAVEQIARLHTQVPFDLTLVKADGARMRGIKAPGPHEPLIVPGTQTLICVVSAGVIGARLNADNAHRPERLAECLDMQLNERITSAHIGALLAHPEVIHQNAGQAQVIALINQVDNAERRALARAAAESAMMARRSPARVVLGAMTASNPLVDIVA